jgi:hypothetical protein
MSQVIIKQHEKDTIETTNKLENLFDQKTNKHGYK